MLFTKIWTAVLAVLATACLAGMYLLSTGASGGFTKADEAAVRAITEAGVAALASDVNSSPVSLGPSLLGDSRLKDALDKPAVPPEDAPPEEQSLQDVFTQVAYDNLLNEYPFMSMAIVDKSGNVLARTGMVPELFDELTKQTALTDALASEDDPLMSATLDGDLHAVKVSRPIGEGQSRRLITIRKVDLAGGSFFRRVVGTENPAGIVRSNEVLGDLIGGAKADELTGWSSAHFTDIPPEGASKVFQVGDGPNARIGAAGRVPGPAGKGEDGTIFIVLSGHTLGSTQTDMTSALKASVGDGGLGQLNWILVGGLLVISLGLTFYLPYIEYNTPLRRLAGEFHGITEGKQHEIYHDTYGGEIAKVARSAQTGMEALRISWEQEWASASEDGEDMAPRRSHSTRSLRAVRRPRTKGNRKVTTGKEAVPAEDPKPETDPEAIELPGVAPAEVERHAAADRGGSKRADPLPSESAPAFQDVVGNPPFELDDGDSVSLASLADDRESYYRSIYKEFVETKAACGENTDGFTYEKFAKKLRKQSDPLLARPEVTDVQFSVYVKDGKAALKAKVIKG